MARVNAIPSRLDAAEYRSRGFLAACVRVRAFATAKQGPRIEHKLTVFIAIASIRGGIESMGARKGQPSGLSTFPEAPLSARGQHARTPGAYSGGGEPRPMGALSFN